MHKEYSSRATRRLERNRRTLKRALLALLIIYFLYLWLVLYKDISKSELLNYCYAFFIGNIIAANGVFSMGRSSIITKMNSVLIERKIHSIAFYFLISAILGLFTCGISFMHVKGTMNIFHGETNSKIVLLILSIIITIGTAFSAWATIKFIVFSISELIYPTQVNENINKSI